MNWLPPIAVMKTWSAEQDRERNYFFWLRPQGSLPDLPSRDSIHNMLLPYWELLRKMHNGSPEAQTAFFNGKINNIFEYKYFSPKDYMEKPSLDQLIEQMLNYNGPVTAAMIDEYHNKIFRLAAPMAAPVG